MKSGLMCWNSTAPKQVKKTSERCSASWWIYNLSERFYRSLPSGSSKQSNNLDKLNSAAKNIIIWACIQFCPQESEFKDFSQEVRNSLYGPWHLITSIIRLWPHFMKFYFIFHDDSLQRWWLNVISFWCLCKTFFPSGVRGGGSDLCVLVLFRSCFSG